MARVIITGDEVHYNEKKNERGEREKNENTKVRHNAFFHTSGLLKLVREKVR